MDYKEAFFKAVKVFHQRYTFPKKTFDIVTRAYKVHPDCISSIVADRLMSCSEAKLAEVIRMIPLDPLTKSRIWCDHAIDFLIMLPFTDGQMPEFVRKLNAFGNINISVTDFGGFTLGIIFDPQPKVLQLHSAYLDYILFHFLQIFLECLD